MTKNRLQKVRALPINVATKVFFSKKQVVSTEKPLRRSFWGFFFQKTRHQPWQSWIATKIEEFQLLHQETSLLLPQTSPKNFDRQLGFQFWRGWCKPALPLSVQLSTSELMGDVWTCLLAPPCFLFREMLHHPLAHSFPNIEKQATELIDASKMNFEDRKQNVFYVPKLWLLSTELRLILKPLPWPATPGHRPKANLIQKRGGLGGLDFIRRGDEVTKSFLEDAVKLCFLSWKTW